MKSAIFADNSVRMYRYDRQRAGLESDPVSTKNAQYAAAGGGRGNLAYG